MMDFLGPMIMNGGAAAYLMPNSTILSSFSSPAVAPTGLAFDGTNLISCDFNSDSIYIHGRG